MVLVAAVPSCVLGRWFDRLPSRGRVSRMTRLEITDLHKAFGRSTRPERCRPHRPGGLVDRDPGGLGERQDDAAAPHRRLRARRPRDDQPRGTRSSMRAPPGSPSERRASATSPRRGVCSPTSRSARTSASACPGRHAAGRRVGELLELIGHGRARWPLSASALGRAAAARGAGPRARHAASAGAAGRAVLVARPDAAGGRPRRCQAPAHELPGRPRCSSPTTRTRRCRSPTRWR